MTTRPESLLPCPFCGEKLVEHDDHHGTWIAHRDEMTGPCIISAIAVYDDGDAKQWNKRAAHAATILRDAKEPT